MLSPMRTAISNRWFSGILLVVASLLFLTDPVAGQLRPRSNLSREPGAIYLEDFLDDRVRMGVPKAISIYATAERKRSVGQLKQRSMVEILAMKDDLYRVRGKARHGQVSGWVLAEQLISKNKDLAANLRKMYERQLVVQDLIDKNQVALGMTLDEVQASMGKPSRKSSKLTKEGRADTYEYVTYDEVPQHRYVRDGFGNLIRQTIYIRVETGKVAISFRDEVVESIEETEGEPRAGAPVRVVPIPIEIW